MSDEKIKKENENFDNGLTNEEISKKKYLDLKQLPPIKIKQELTLSGDENTAEEPYYDVANWNIKSEEIEIKSDSSNSSPVFVPTKNSVRKTQKRKKTPHEKTRKRIRQNFLDCLETLKPNKKVAASKTQKVNEFSCTYCQFSADNKESVRKHSVKHKSVLKNGKYRCFECPFTTNHRESIKMHVNTHKPILEVEGFKCCKCNYITRYKMSLKNHLKLHLSPEKLKLLDVHKCPTCNYATREKGNLTRHMKKHKSKEEVPIFSCKNCKFQTKYKENLKRHSSVHKPLSKKKHFDCILCNFRTPHEERLRSHMLTHKDKSQTLLTCKHCNFQTFHSGNLMLHYKREHKAVANKIFKFKCTQCHFKTTTAQNLNTHIDRYHKNNFFTCKYCSYKTVYHQNLKKHHLNHSSAEKRPNDIILKCSRCTFQTPTKLSMLSHELAHKKSTKLISCQFCSYQTLHGAGLQKHYLNKHSGWSSTNKELFIKIVPWELK